MGSFFVKNMNPEMRTGFFRGSKNSFARDRSERVDRRTVCIRRTPASEIDCGYSINFLAMVEFYYHSSIFSFLLFNSVKLGGSIWRHVEALRFQRSDFSHLASPINIILLLIEFFYTPHAILKLISGGMRAVEAFFPLPKNNKFHHNFSKQ